MTEISQTVFDRYQVRKTRKQRDDFRDYLAVVARDLGYPSHEENGALGSRNVIVGDPETARVVYTAHYDTCARLPFPNFITPTNFGIYLLYQLAIVLAFFLLAGIAMVVLTFAMGALSALLDIPKDVAVMIALYGSYALLLAGCYLIIGGPANRHTANDNTSGVITLLELMVALPEARRGDVAFIFFDLEEAGMFGSAGYRSRHKKALKDTLLINFDCVSDGKNILFAVRKQAAPYVAALETAYACSETFDVKVLTRGVFYPSDQMQFPGGVGVAALKKTKHGLLYMDRIHTDRDTVFEEDNIAFLVEGSLRLTEAIAGTEIEA